LSFLLGFSFHFQKRFGNIKRKLFILTIVVALFYGAFDELHQMFIPGRFADIYDWLADAVGSMSGVLIVFILIRKNAAVTK
jgi:VanZ family protein